MTKYENNATEHAIVHGLLHDPEFAAIALHKIESSHFKEEPARLIFETILSSEDKRTSFTFDEIKTDIRSLKTSPELKEAMNEYMQSAGDLSTDYLVDTTEKYCRERGIMNALFEAVEISNDPKKSLQIPELLTDATSFSFDVDLALDYKNDIEERVKSYTDAAVKIPMKLGMINKITNGGIEKRTLTVGLAPTGFGKSIWMADDALFQANRGLNVVYYTFEMSDTRIAKRVDANDLDMKMGDVEKYKSNLEKAFKKQQETMKGNIFFKEFAPDVMTAAGLASHMKQLQHSKGIKIDIVYVDYLNLMRSAGESSNAGTYKKIEGVAKELIRHLAKGFDIPVVTVSQVGRQAQSREAQIEDVAESQGLSNTVDLLLSFYETPELKEMGTAKMKQLKNRFGSLDYYRNSLIGLDRSKMRYFDCDESLSDTLLGNGEDDDKPVADNTEFMQRTNGDALGGLGGNPFGAKSWI